MKDLSCSYTKHVHFTYDEKNDTQKDGVAMGSPLGLPLANIFMISLEEAILPSIKKQYTHWKRYVDETRAYIDASKIKFVLEKLNNHQPNIQFKHKIKENQKITFLDLLITCTGNND